MKQGTGTHIRYFSAMLAWAMLVAVAPVQAAGIVDATLDSKQLLERHDPEVKVSGNIVVGVMTENAYQALLDDSIGIAFPENQDQQSLCLKVSSRDGVYSSENIYSFSTHDEYLVALPYHTSLGKILGEYTTEPGAIAMTVTPGTCSDSATTDYYLPAVLDRAGERLRPGRITLYINSIDATDVYYRTGKSADGDVSDCDYIEQGRHTAYNFICEVDYDKPIENNEITIQIVREVYGREITPDLAITLRSPAQVLTGTAGD